MQISDVIFGQNVQIFDVKITRFVLFRLIKKRSFNLLCVLHHCVCLIAVLSG